MPPLFAETDPIVAVALAAGGFVCGLVAFLATYRLGVRDGVRLVSRTVVIKPATLDTPAEFAASATLSKLATKVYRSKRKKRPAPHWKTAVSTPPLTRERLGEIMQRAVAFLEGSGLGLKVAYQIGDGPDGGFEVNATVTGDYGTAPVTLRGDDLRSEPTIRFRLIDAWSKLLREMGSRPIPRAQVGRIA